MKTAQDEGLMCKKIVNGRDHKGTSCIWIMSHSDRRDFNLYLKSDQKHELTDRYCHANFLCDGVAKYKLESQVVAGHVLLKEEKQ